MYERTFLPSVHSPNARLVPDETATDCHLYSEYFYFGSCLIILGPVRSSSQRGLNNGEAFSLEEKLP